MSKSNLHYSLLPCIECALLVLTALSNCYCSVWALEHSVGLTIHNSGTSYKKSHVCAVLAAVKKLRTNRKKQQTEFHEAPPASLSWSRYVSHHRAKAPCSQKQEPDLWLGLSIVWDLAKTKGHYNLMSFFFFLFLVGVDDMAAVLCGIPRMALHPVPCLTPCLVLQVLLQKNVGWTATHSGHRGGVIPLSVTHSRRMTQVHLMPEGNMMYTVHNV